MLSMKWRATIFVAATTASLLTISLWPAHWLRYNSFGMPMDLALTWWAPGLLLLIPVSLCWASFGANSRRVMNIGVASSLALLCFLVLLMVYVSDFVQPFCGFWQGCGSNWSLQN